MSVPSSSNRRPSSRALVVGALGVVFGDIGTSPLYALKECFHGRHGVPITDQSVIGILSLIFWSLILIVSIKYLVFVMRANNRGEGGILALMAMAVDGMSDRSRRRRLLVLLGVFGAALLYGDGMITPAITTLGAFEGLEVATSFFSPWVVPLTMGVLVVLFSFQRFGTEQVGRFLRTRDGAVVSGAGGARRSRTFPRPARVASLQSPARSRLPHPSRLAGVRCPRRGLSRGHRR